MRAPSPLSKLGEMAVEGAGLLASLPLWIWWAVWKGGYPPAVFLVGIGYLALAAVALRLFAPPGRPEGAPAWALGALGALTAWTLASLLWAADQGAGEVAGARQILLFGSFALPLLWPPSARALMMGVAVVPLVALCGAVSALGGALDDPLALVDGRLEGPTGYANASAALMAMGILPALVLGSRRELSVALRAVMLAAAGGLLGAFLLTQSRGGLVALCLALLLAFLLVPGRLRLLVATGIVAIAVGPALDSLLEVRSVAVDAGDATVSLRDGVAALATSTFVLAGLATIYAALDSRVEISPRVVRRSSVGVALALSGAALVAFIALLASGPNVGAWVSERVDDFKTPDYARLESQPTRFTGDLGSNRYDYWRVSVEVFADKPLTGSGAGNFIASFLERRRADKSTIYSHNTWLGTLAELGAVGFLALLTFAASLALALVRAGRSQGPRRWIVTAAALPLAYVFIHGTIDWIAVFPVVSAPALALAAAASRVGRPTGPASGRQARLISLALVGALATATFLAAPLLLSARLSDRGVTTWQLRPAGAIDDLQRAADLDPLAAAPYVRLGVVATELRHRVLARRAFQAALDRDASAWYPEFQLGLLAAARGNRALALDKLNVALARNPGEPLVRRALRGARLRRELDPREFQHRVLRDEDG